MLSATLLLVAIPAVVLSEGHQAMTRVAVGDTFPAVEGRTEAGGPATLASLAGPRATVVAVPGGAAWMDAMLTGDLAGDFAPKYADEGVNFVLLAGESPGERVAALDVARAKLTESLGGGRMPRVYVLDPAGKVLWFDLEYTLSTHRELHAALDELLAR